ncbi:MAG: UvrD-helicase domain-containing protein [Candidatus Binataceae bacterium]
MTVLADQTVRDRIRFDLDATLVIEAAAGTGKTTALVNRIVSTIASGRATLDRVVAVTFTDKAAGELKLRLRSEIEQARHCAINEDAARLLTAALRQLEEAHIGTIHAFCADILRERPIEAGVDPMFEMAPPDAAGELFGVAFERWFQQMLAAPGEGMRRLLRRRSRAGEDGPRELARRAAFELLDWRDFDAPWRSTEFDRDGEIDRLIDEIRALAEIGQSAPPDDWLSKAIDEIWQPISDALRLEAVLGRDYDALEAVLLGLLSGSYDGRWRWKGYGDEFGAASRADALNRRKALREHLEKFRIDAGASLAPHLRAELWPIAADYQELKNRAGVLDFLDLLLITRDLVRGNAAIRTWLQSRFTHIFVDEFQDTDPLQAEIIMLLAADDPDETGWARARPIPGKLFIVGDPKQSIYRFRRADVSLYQNVKRRLLERGAQVEYLTVSFRATPELQKMVNAAFAPLMAAESESQPLYAPLMPSRPDFPDQPAIVALPVPEPYSKHGMITKRQIDESLPGAIGAYVKWLIEESGWTVTTRELPERRIPIRPSDICILFRRFTAYGRDVARGYMRALEARQIPHVLIRGSSFNEREEVEAIRNALGAIERPDDELVVFAALRGPFFAVGDDVLLEFRETIGSLHPFRAIPEDLAPALKEAAEALNVVRELHRGRNRRPIADTISQLLARTRAHAGIAIWPAGEQALANIMRVMDMARRYEARSGATSFRGFVDALEERAERDEPGEAPIVEDGAEGVRIMSVHRAKGLEFPIVILADITCNETASEANRHVDPALRLCALRLAGCAPMELTEHNEAELRRESEEAVRLVYVAVTRARDLIVVPVVGDEMLEGWAAKLNPVIYPAPIRRRTPLTHQPPGCPEFGEDSVKVRPPAPKTPGIGRSVAPGLHQPRNGEQRVVWWDPAKLDLDVRETMGLRQVRLLEADGGGRAGNSDRRYQEWKARRESIIERGSAPTMRVATVTELAESMIAEFSDAGIEIVEIGSGGEGPHGARIGTLVHLIMLRAPFDSGRDELARIAAMEGRMLGAPDDEIAAAIDAVAGALDSSLIARAARASECRRECATMINLPDGTMAEGVADLAFLENDNGRACWTVVDFKTDADLTRRLGEYRAQLGLYMRAISASSGIPARGVILKL